METLTTAEATFSNASDNDVIFQRKRLFCNTCWVISDFAVLLVILLGNVLTILAVRLSRRLRKVTSNQLVLSLAVSDLVVGFAVLYHLFFFIESELNENKATCVLRFILLFCGCYASFFNVTTIALDRYLAIVHPLKYPEYVTSRVVYGTIATNWAAAIFVSTVPAYWNNYARANSCEIDTVIPSFYTIAILMPLFLTVWMSILVLYWRIWKEAKTHAERCHRNGFINIDSSHKKSNQVVLLILGCFSLCWLPYVIVALTQVTSSGSANKPSPTLYHVMFSVAMCNSGVNPLIYAWKNPSFRAAFLQLLRLRSPDRMCPDSNFEAYLRGHQRELEIRKSNNNNCGEARDERIAVLERDTPL